jgi:hypothetical protein
MTRFALRRGAGLFTGRSAVPTLVGAQVGMDQFDPFQLESMS